MQISNVENNCNSSTLKIYIDQNICTGCGLCDEVCPFGLPKVNIIGKYEIQRLDLCTECSACKRNCPVNAIIMTEKKGCGCLWDVKARQKHRSNKNNQGSQKKDISLKNNGQNVEDAKSSDSGCKCQDKNPSGCC